MKISDEPVVVEQIFNKSIEAVWNSITNPELMRQWFFDNIPDFKPEAGFETSFNVAGPSRDFLHMWRITKVVPREKIIYNWRYEGLPGDSFVIFELFKEDNLTRLRLTTEILEDFPEDIPEFARESCVGGWEYFICKRLKEFLDN